MKRVSVFPVGVALLLIVGQAFAEPAGEKVVVTINGHPITESQVIEEADRRINASAARSATMGLIYDEATRNESRDAARDAVLHTLIERRLIAEQLTSDRIVITDAEVDACLDDRAKRRGQTRAEAEADIRDQGKTLADTRERLRWHTLGVMKLYEAHAKNKKVMSETEARAVYDQNPGEFKQEHERRVSRILFSAPPDGGPILKDAARAKAAVALRRIKAGEDFAVVAGECSEDVLTKKQGGDRGWSPRGFVTAAGNDPFGDAAFALQNVGDVSDVVQTLDGYEIIKLTGVKPERQKPFDEVKADIIDRERHWEIGNFWETYGSDLRKHASIVWSADELARQKKNEAAAKLAQRQDEQAKQ